MNNVVVLVGILITVNDFIRFSTCHFKETFRRMATQVADQVVKGLFRTVLVVPLALLFLANLAGVVASLSMAASSMAASHNTKKKLKAILNLDKLVEVALIAVAFVRFTIFPSPTTPREVYVGNIFHSVVFLLQCQGVTRLSWDDSTTTATSNIEATEQQPPALHENEPFDSGFNDYNDNGNVNLWNSYQGQQQGTLPSAAHPSST
jgi:hypothetical protein